MGNSALTDLDKKFLIEQCTNQIKKLEEQVLRYQNILNKLQGSGNIENKPSELGEKLHSFVDNIGGYSPEPPAEKKPIPRQNWKRISLNALKELNSFSTTHDIYDFLIKESPSFIDYDQSDIISKLSTALSNLYGKQNIRRLKNTLGRGYFWALPAWYSPELLDTYKSKLIKKYGVDESALFGELGKSNEIDEADLPF